MTKISEKAKAQIEAYLKAIEGKNVSESLIQVCIDGLIKAFPA